MYNHKEMEGKVLERWGRINIVKKIKSRAKKKKKFFLLDGPPYVNGVAHVGHVKTTTAKDIWTKLKIMQGFDVWLQPGFDCHGLPVETEVEKSLGIKSKSDIEKMGKDVFIQHCLDKVRNNEKSWMELYKLLGAWRGWEEPYLTYKSYYIESAWWTLKKLHESGMLVEGLKPIFWCWRCETALSGYEVTDSYADLTDPGIYVKFKVSGSKNEYLIVFTTTPWTLFGNVAIAVNPRETYVKAKAGGEVYIIAEKRAKPVLEGLLGLEYAIEKKMKGEELDGIKYEPALKSPVQDKAAGRVVLSIPIMKYKKYKKHRMGEGKDEREEFGEFVTVEEGSGLVHTAPGHGSSDAEVGKYYGLPSLSPVDERGRFTQEVGKLSGMFVKEADEKIIEELKENKLLLYAGKITHSYPVCWRCKSPLIYRSSKQWFLKVDPIKDKMILENEKVRWLPDFSQKRFHNWLIDAIDWCISQQRYWGIPLPIWVCGKCGKKSVVGSVRELKENALEKVPKDLDLHVNSVDKIRLKCGCSGTMERVPDIANVWFDSGVSPWASLGYPFQNKKLFESLWPIDMITEAQDQIRGWFYSLMFCGIATFGSAPYKTVGMTGWVLDEKGEKMSKSLGNVVIGSDAVKSMGADVLRLYYCWEVPPWEIQKFSFKTAEELRRALNILWNTYIFYKTYSEASKYRGEKPKKLEVEDQWIISRANSVAQEVTNSLESFEFHLAGRSVVNFILEDLSRWYVKIIKDRTWPTYGGRDKGSAFYALRYSLEVLSKLLAPVCPFIAEELYLGLNKREESVHLSEWFYGDKKLIKKDLEGCMEVAKKVVEASSSLRHEKGVKLKYVLSSVLVKGDKNFLRAVKSTESVISRLANVKGVKEQKISKEHSKEVEGGLVSLDFKASEELKKEWLLRELVRSIQERRKELGLKVKDKIVVYIPSAFKSFEKTIREETCSKVVFGQGGERSSFEFEGKKYEFGVEKSTTTE